MFVDKLFFLIAEFIILVQKKIVLRDFVLSASKRFGGESPDILPMSNYLAVIGMGFLLFKGLL